MHMVRKHRSRWFLSLLTLGLIVCMVDSAAWAASAPKGALPTIQTRIDKRREKRASTPPLDLFCCIVCTAMIQRHHGFEGGTLRPGHNRM